MSKNLKNVLQEVLILKQQACTMLCISRKYRSRLRLFLYGLTMFGLGLGLSYAIQLGHDVVHGPVVYVDSDKFELCGEGFLDDPCICDGGLVFEDIPNNMGSTLWVITPTYHRPEQQSELIRLAQALQPVRSFIHWIVVQDVHGPNGNFGLEQLEKFLEKRVGKEIKWTLLSTFSPPGFNPARKGARGIMGRKTAVEWLKKKYYNNASSEQDVIYFADDDNTYATDIFKQIRSTKKVSMWPVGLIGQFGVSSPIVQKNKVVGFYDHWNGARKWHVDMAGFAINMKVLFDAKIPWNAEVGYLEDQLLSSLNIGFEDIQPLANKCTEILVWHTRTQRHDWPKHPRSMDKSMVGTTNLIHLMNSLPQQKSSTSSTFSFSNYRSSVLLILVHAVLYYAFSIETNS